jgi:hypothetical protein
VRNPKEPKLVVVSGLEPAPKSTLKRERLLVKKKDNTQIDVSRTHNILTSKRKEDKRK